MKEYEIISCVKRPEKGREEDPPVSFFTLSVHDVSWFREFSEFRESLDPALVSGAL